MRPKAYGIALRDIPSPNGTIGAFAYREGDEIEHPSVVDTLGLTWGVDVRPIDENVIPRPGEDDDRRAWEAYCIGQGMAVEDAQAASLAELREAYPEPEARDDFVPLPPAKSATKAEWVEYVSKHRGVTAEDAEAMTKDDLVTEYGPKG